MTHPNLILDSPFEQGTDKTFSTQKILKNNDFNSLTTFRPKNKAKTSDDHEI